MICDLFGIETDLETKGYCILLVISTIFEGGIEMKTNLKTVMVGLILMSSFFMRLPQELQAAPPILTDEEIAEAEAEENEDEDKEKEKKDKATLKKEKKEKALKKTLGKMRRRLSKAEKKLRVRVNNFSSTYKISDCTGADKARARLTDVGDEGGIIIQGKLNIASSNVANIDKNEGSINNNTSVTIINENNKRC